jgi:hypothetical protein
MRKLRIVLLTLIFLVAAAAIVAVRLSPRAHTAVSAATYDDTAALDDALKNGLITQDEYQSRLEQIGASAHKKP